MIFRGYGAPEERVADLVARFRFLYPDIVVPATVAMAGAADALAAVRAHGGRTLVLTGKYTSNAALHLKALGWEVDVLVGGLWAAGKGVELARHQASVYVGDHGGDMVGAVAAGAVGVGVTTGPCDAETLLAAGAEVVLSSLDEFPAWLDSHLRRTA
ncbi:haloacid dehalogenase-like hydrolase [Actinokineospora sp. HBU206404]|uniref:Haloacid dehalogenase-like hydrolase n=1 Tax=Actinokineospora xionganensis TaxID=2684470 RepID=A0ABR7L3E6_9PSEU|nr:haloacid dehalogenase-like hydrolase [Actinokineospora xionganensis]